jgi:ribose-phosphate pyrophosphokinase
MKDRRCVLFAGNASQKLADSITTIPHMGIQSGNIYHHKFPSGEWYCQLKENVRGDDVFLINAICEPANDNLMQLLIMADAARRASADRITAVIPYFGYQRQDRKDKPRVPISAKLIMNLLEASGIDRVITMDLHAQQIQGFTDLPVDHLYFQPTLAKALANLNIQVVVAPDIGAVKKASEYAEREKMDIAFIIKKRKNDTDVEVTQFVGDVKGKNVLVLDDLTESAGTIISAANCCKTNGADNVYGAVTHGCLSRIGIVRLNEATMNGTIKHFFCSDTVTEDCVQAGAGGTIVSVAEVFAKAIHGTHFNESITSLFQ